MNGIILFSLSQVKKNVSLKILYFNLFDTTYLTYSLKISALLKQWSYTILSFLSMKVNEQFDYNVADIFNLIGYE